MAAEECVVAGSDVDGVDAGVVIAGSGGDGCGESDLVASGVVGLVDVGAGLIGGKLLGSAVDVELDLDGLVGVAV